MIKAKTKKLIIIYSEIDYVMDIDYINRLRKPLKIIHLNRILKL